MESGKKGTAVLASPRPSPNRPIRLHKYLAQCGVGSRRACEGLIAAGHVSVNGVPELRLGVRIDPQRDQVTVDGRPCRPERFVYLAVNKPRGVVCTCRDPQHRRTILDLVPATFGRLYPVGRLDRDSEGLVLLTNDGDTAHRLAHPRHRITKQYVVRVAGVPSAAQLQQMRRGIRSGPELLRLDEAQIVRREGVTAWCRLVLHQGRKREIRRMLEVLGFRVLRLCRTAIGPITLGKLAPGRWRHLTPLELSRFTEPPTVAGAPGGPEAPGVLPAPAARP